MKEENINSERLGTLCQDNHKVCACPSVGMCWNNMEERIQTSENVALLIIQTENFGNI